MRGRDRDQLLDVDEQHHHDEDVLGLGHQGGGAPVLRAADGGISKGHVLVGRPHPMGQGVVQRVRPIGTIALGSGRREFSVRWSSGAMEE